MLKAAAVLFLVPVYLLAQGDATKPLQNAAALAAAGKYSEAEPILTRALAAEEANPTADHPLLVPILDALGAVYRAEGKIDNVEATYLRVLQILEQSDGENSVTLIPHLKLLAGAYVALTLPADAEKALLRAISIRQKTSDASELDLANDYAELGSFYLAQKRYAVAEPNFRRAIAFIKQKIFPPAEQPLRRVVWIQERVVGPNDVKLAPNLDRLALLLFEEKRYPEAETLYRRSLAIWEPNMGPINPSLTTALDNLAVVLAAQMKFPEATPIYTRALAIREKATVENMNNVALVLQGKGDTDASEKNFTRALDLASEIPALPGDKSVGEKELLGKVLDNYVDMLKALMRTEDAARVKARWRPTVKTTASK